MTKTQSGISLAAIFLICIGISIGYVFANIRLDSAANALDIRSASGEAEMPSVENVRQDKPNAISPVKALKNRVIYYPGTEDLKPDEMRVTALGTGMPSARPKQAAACFLVEMSEFTLSGRKAFPEVVAALYGEINKIYGTDFKPGIKE